VTQITKFFLSKESCEFPGPNDFPKWMFFHKIPTQEYELPS
jgi:hypothetical protein